MSTPRSVTIDAPTASTTIKNLRDKIVEELSVPAGEMEVDGMRLSREQLLVHSVTSQGATSAWRFNKRCDDDDDDEEEEEVVVEMDGADDEYDMLFEDGNEFRCLCDTEFLLSELDVKDGKLTVHAYIKRVHALTVTVVNLGGPEYRPPISTVA